MSIKSASSKYKKLLAREKKKMLAGKGALLQAQRQLNADVIAGLKASKSEERQLLRERWAVRASKKLYNKIHKEE